MNTSDLLSLRLSNQQLIKPNFVNVGDLVKWFGAMQAQDYPAALWGLAQRLPNQNFSNLEEAFNKGEILRTHVMRPTWHFVHPTDARWMLELTGPRVSRLMASYNKQLELTDDVFKNAQKIFIKHLHENKAVTRQELKKELERVGIKTNIQRLSHLVMQAELDCVLISGPRIGKQFSYMLFEERVPNAKKLHHDEALAELTKRYFQSHGPATIRDFGWWSGLTLADIKKGIEMTRPELENEVINNKIYWFFSSRIPKLPLTCYLLPNYDEYGIAYTERESFFKPEYNKLLNSRGNAVFQHLIVINGQIIGTWKRTLVKNSVTIETKFFEKPSHSELKIIIEATHRYSDFLNIPVEII